MIFELWAALLLSSFFFIYLAYTINSPIFKLFAAILLFTVALNSGDIQFKFSSLNGEEYLKDFYQFWYLILIFSFFGFVILLDAVINIIESVREE